MPVLPLPGNPGSVEQPYAYHDEQPPMNPDWDELYSRDGYAYGTEPNGFLVSVATILQRGPTLCLAAGEGRNAVYLASMGFEVLAIDASAVGLAKANRLAREQGVRLATQQVDLHDFDMGEACFENIVSVFCHVPSRLRRRVHAGVVRALRPGGMFLLEAFRPEQLEFASGGPLQLDLLMSREQVEAELQGLEMVRVGRVVRTLSEGSCHNGHAAVLDIVARKPYVHLPRGAAN
jgi:SAM-dependent methyltransferase